MENVLTEGQPKLTRKPPLSKARVDQAVGRSHAEIIAAGVQYIFTQQQNARWSGLGLGADSPDQWVTAYVLGRLGDLPGNYFSPAQAEQMEQALEWLLQSRTPDAAWGCTAGSVADADATAWALIALRNHGKAAPAPAIHWLQSCRRADGGFAPHPETCQAACCGTSLPGITAIAVKALGELDSRTEGHLERWLTQAPSDSSARASSFYVCSEVLDCDAALAPWSLLNRACYLTVLNKPAQAFEIALLLRSLLRMRMRTSWSIAEALRALQQTDGSWPANPILGPVLPGVRKKTNQAVMDCSGLLATATAVSALWMAESRPRLSFGSDLPRPRRLPEL